MTGFFDLKYQEKSSSLVVDHDNKNLAKLEKSSDAKL